MLLQDDSRARPDLKHDWQAVANQIADELNEQTGPPRRQIRHIVQAIGIEQALALLAEAQTITAHGGAMTIHGKQRTPGGIFFRLVRQLGGENEQIHLLFMAHPPRRKGNANATQKPQAPAGNPPRWGDRLLALDSLNVAPGEAKTMKVTLTGRPGNIVDKGTYVMLAMPAQKLPALPKGLPVLPADAIPPQTLVLIARKQWSRVETVLSDPDDFLLIEGVAVYEEAVHGLTVLATNVSTRSLQRAKRPPSAPTDVQE